jgi:hypothetical protein
MAVLVTAVYVFNGTTEHAEHDRGEDKVLVSGNAGDALAVLLRQPDHKLLKL